MEVDSDNGLLGKLAAGGEIESSAWPQLREEMVEQLDKIARNEFPIPSLPAPLDPRSRLLSPLPSSPLEQTSSQEANKENAPAERTAAPVTTTAPPIQNLEPGELPKQIQTMLDGIIVHLKTFESHPPHTIQRLAELVSRPHAHYKALAPYLHAVDRVVHVTSSTKIYPLPPAIPDMATMSINGDDVADPAAAVGWANPTNGNAAADEALGGALLTPIPWLNRPSPESNNGDSSSSGGGSGAQIHSESTETIDGPNGVGSIETVSVSVNGVPSTGHARGVTQGELLRQEQRAGVVPVSQLSRNQNGHEHSQVVDAAGAAARANQDEDYDGEAEEGADAAELGGDQQDDEEMPHARGPDEIGAGDIGPQSVSTSFVGEGGLDSHDIDVEAAVGRKHDVGDAPIVSASSPTTITEAGDVSVTEDEAAEPETEAKAEDDKASVVSETPSSATESAAGTKRGPETEEEGGTAKKLKEEGDGMDTDTTV